MNGGKLGMLLYVLVGMTNVAIIVLCYGFTAANMLWSLATGDGFAELTWQQASWTLVGPAIFNSIFLRLFSGYNDAVKAHNEANAKAVKRTGEGSGDTGK